MMMIRPTLIVYWTLTSLYNTQAVRHQNFPPSAIVWPFELSMESRDARVLPSYETWADYAPSILHLRSGMGQTDGQTDDGHQFIMPPLYGAGV